MRGIARLIVLLPVGLSLGCAAEKASRPSGLPYEAWSLGFVAPDHMEVWIEAAEAEDVRGRLFAKLETGTASIGSSGDAAGWGGHVGFGKSRQVTGAALPKRVYVRWQSLVEPKTYGVFIDIDETTRRLMLMSDPPPPNTNFPKDYRFYRKYLVLGLAPGGWVKGWVTSASGDPVEVLCVRGEAELEGPSEGRNGGRYAYAIDQLESTTQEYLKNHAIRYDSWKCDAANDDPAALGG